MTTRLPIVDPNYTPLVRDTKTINLSTQSSSGVLLNGDKKSKVFYELKNFIDYENDGTIEYISVSMPYVVLCNSNYIVNETNNVLDIKVINVNTQEETFYTYTIPVGNYSASSLANTINALALAQDFVFRIDQITQKYEFRASYNDAVLLGTSTCDYIIGFSGDFFCPSSGFTKMPRCFNLLPVPRFNILGDFLSNGVLLTNGSKDFGTGTILASVPNNSKNNNLIVYETDANEFILKNCSLNNLTISIEDDRGNLINFNGIASYFQLRFSIFRKRQPKLLPFTQIVDYASSFNIPDDAQVIDYA